MRTARRFYGLVAREKKFAWLVASYVAMSWLVAVLAGELLLLAPLLIRRDPSGSSLIFASVGFSYAHFLVESWRRKTLPPDLEQP